MLFLKSLLIWFFLVVIAILNGAFRNYFILPVTGESAAHVLSTFILITFHFIVISYFVRSVKISDRRILLQIGAFWLTLTIFFEFIFGHYVMAHPWEKLIGEYNIFKGRVWILVLLNTFFSPYISGEILKSKLRSSPAFRINKLPGKFKDEVSK